MNWRRGLRFVGVTWGTILLVSASVKLIGGFPTFVSLLGAAVSLLVFLHGSYVDRKGP